MFGLESLDVVIGLLFVYLLLSLICVALNEAIAHFLHLRGKMLQDAIFQLLTTSPKRPDRAEVARGFGNALMNRTYSVAGYRLAEQVYAHPLIAGMKERYSLRVFNFFRRKGLTPSYIPSATFVSVLLDVIRRHDLAAGTAAPAIAQIPLNGQQLETDFGQVGQVLRLFADRAHGDIHRFERNLQGWFDESMDRLRASYKRRVQLVGMAVAIVVAVSVNANTIAIIRTLSTNATLRQALVAMATDVVTDSTNPPTMSDSAASDVALTRVTDLTIRLDSIGVLGLPIGYPPLSAATEQLRNGPARKFAGAVFRERWPIVRRGWLGLLLTAFAITLGAPFWFDLLNRVVSLRSSGNKPRDG